MQKCGEDSCVRFEEYLHWVLPWGRVWGDYSIGKWELSAQDNRRPVTEGQIREKGDCGQTDPNRMPGEGRPRSDIT